MKSQRYKHYLGFSSWFGFLRATTRKVNQTAAKPIGKGRGLNYEQSPTWITQFRVCMWKLWCLEVEKIGEEILDGISHFFFLKWNGREWEYLKERREREKATNDRQPCHPFHVWHTWTPSLAERPRLLLSHSALILRPYSGLWTPILNPSFDYKLWLPHAQRWL